MPGNLSNTAISSQTILDLLGEMERGTPVDAPLTETEVDALRVVVATEFSSLHQRFIDLGLSASTREAVLLAMASRIVLDNVTKSACTVCASTRVVARIEFERLLARLGVSRVGSQAKGDCGS